MNQIGAFRKSKYPVVFESVGKIKNKFRKNGNSNRKPIFW